MEIEREVDVVSYPSSRFLPMPSPLPRLIAYVLGHQNDTRYRYKSHLLNK